MQIIKHHFENSIQIVNLGDIHYGDHACDRDLLREHIKYIQEEPNTFWVSTGDMLNVALKDAVSSVYYSDNLEEEQDALILELAPIKEKCLGFVSSNHHDRFDRAVGMSLDKLISRLSGLPFLGDFGLLNVVCGRNSYYLTMHHGTGAGRTKGAKANEIARLADVVPGSDIYMQGHSHTFQWLIDESYQIDKKRVKVSTVRQHYVTTGHYLDYPQSYAAKKKYIPSAKGAVIVRLKGGDSGYDKNISVDFLGV